MGSARANLQATVIGVAVLLVIGGVAWFGVGGDTAVPTTLDVGAIGVEAGLVAVHVSGAVVRPGLVMVDGDARVADAVAAAGGATVDADLGRTNLAAPVRDGEHVVVPSTVDGPDGSVEQDGIDLNTASVGRLEDLPGVGPVLAERIVAFREEHGPFATVEDLLDVPGIGEAKLAQMRGAITAP
jgi:competence protein ComEA